MPGGGAPQPPGAPPVGTGAAAAPSPMLGSQAQAASKLEAGLKMMQEALSGLPFGSELHHEVLDALKKIGKHMPQGGAGTTDPTAVIQQLAAAARAQKAQPQQHAALAGLMAGPGMGGGTPPGAPGPE